MTEKLKNTGDNKVEIHNVKTLLLKLQEIQGEMDITDDEMRLIVYTSLDHDWFTNLIV